MQVRTEFGRRRTKEQRKALENGEEMRIKLPPAYEKVCEVVKLATRIGPNYNDLSIKTLTTFTSTIIPVNTI